MSHRKQMTDDEFKTWEPLIRHVVVQCFSWAYDSGTDADRRFRRNLQYDDLYQEGAIGLLKAWTKYNADRSDAASFKTYAYHAIRNRILKYVNANISPLTTTGWNRPGTQENPEVKDRLRDALGCALFSELEEVDNPAPMEVVGDGPRENEMAHEEWIANCMARLEKVIGRRKLKLLMKRFGGATLREIGRGRRKSREHARKLLVESLLAAAVAMYPIEMERYEK